MTCHLLLRRLPESLGCSGSLFRIHDLGRRTEWECQIHFDQLDWQLQLEPDVYESGSERPGLVGS